ncbi:hypothetical protein [Neobacillus soli]|uniref:hypothetical protein n=1 Tax=Neobacillus soli TaxID=220688 RepID=UPI0008260711|nr:hypothetical protein [Neobacillus soli]
MPYSLKRCGAYLDKEGKAIPKHLYIVRYAIEASAIRREKVHKMTGKKKQDIYGKRRAIFIKRLDKLMDDDGNPKDKLIESIIKKKVLLYHLIKNDKEYLSLPKEEQKDRLKEFKDKYAEEAANIAKEEKQLILKNWGTIVGIAYL